MCQHHLKILEINKRFAFVFGLLDDWRILGDLGESSDFRTDFEIFVPILGFSMHWSTLQSNKTAFK